MQNYKSPTDESLKKASGDSDVHGYIPTKCDLKCHKCRHQGTCMINKEIYRYEVARKLRLRGELDLEGYRELASGYSRLRRKILGLTSDNNLINDVLKFLRVMRFSNEVAGLYLTDYLDEVRVV